MSNLVISLTKLLASSRVIIIAVLGTSPPIGPCCSKKAIRIRAPVNTVYLFTNTAGHFKHRSADRAHRGGRAHHPGALPAHQEQSALCRRPLLSSSSSAWSSSRFQRPDRAKARRHRALRGATQISRASGQPTRCTVSPSNDPTSWRTVTACPTRRPPSDVSRRPSARSTRKASATTTARSATPRWGIRNRRRPSRRR